jgi:hypothetical protein
LNCPQSYKYRQTMTSSAITRRALLTGIGSIVVGAPAIVRVSSLMPVKVVEWTPFFPATALPETGERPWAGWVERVGFQMMDRILRTGYTPERAARSFYRTLSERQMRNRVAYARRHGFLSKERE